MSYDIPMVSFVGYSGSGKTTFIEKLIPELKSRNIRLAVIKHDAHDFTIDKEGKDTWRFANAGADIVSISSFEKLALIEKTEKELTLEDIISYIKGVDLIITEGYRAGHAPKIGVYRQASGHELSLSLEELTAVVSDVQIETDIPCFDLEDVKAVADYLQNYIINQTLEWISLEQAKDILLDIPVNLQREYVALNEADERILAQDIVASEQIPHFDKSPLDGYAFKAEDTVNASQENPITFQITEEIPAGKYPDYKVEHGTAAKILTGAPIPEGADAVIRYEDTVFTDSTVTIFSSFESNTNIVPAGEDIEMGDRVAQKGISVTPALSGLAASLGVSALLVYKKPVITVVNTGDELISVNEPLANAKIRNSSHYTISSYLRQAGAVSLDGGIAKDNAQDIARAIKSSLVHSDMVITTGGVSVGDYDMVKAALELLGAEILFWRIGIKPGGAVVAAVLDGKMILGLSGNPGSAGVTLQLLGMPFIYKLTGRIDIEHQKIQVKMLQPYKKSSPTRRFLRGRLVIKDTVAYFEQNDSQENGTISSLKGCDLIGEIKPGTPCLNKDDTIDAYLIGR